MTDQEKRYRCPGCGNEEGWALIEAAKERPTGSGNVICPSFRCFSYAKHYQLIEEPEPEGAREWSKSGHRHPQGRWPTACGIGSDKCRGNLYTEPQGTPCPACLPKPEEGEKSQLMDWLRCRSVIHRIRSLPDSWDDAGTPAFSQAIIDLALERIDALQESEQRAPDSITPSSDGSIILAWRPDRGIPEEEIDEPSDEPAEDPPPPRAEWVPPEWDQHEGEHWSEHYKRVMASLGKYVNAMLARATETSRLESFSEQIARSAENMATRQKDHGEPHDAPWTSVEDGLPEDEEDVQVLTTAWYGKESQKWRVDEGRSTATYSQRPVSHWRPKPEVE